MNLNLNYSNSVQIQVKHVKVKVLLTYSVMQFVAVRVPQKIKSTDKKNYLRLVLVLENVSNKS